MLVAQSVVLPVAQPSMNWLGGGFLLAAFMAMHAGYGFTRAKLDETALRWAAGALIVGGLFAVFCQVIQLFHLEVRVSPLVVAYNVTVERRPFGNMAQANHLATYIAFAMAGALFLVQTRRLAVSIWLLVSTIFAVGLALTVSRGPWLQMGVIVVAGFWMAFAQMRSQPQLRRSNREWLIPIALAVLFFVVNALIRWANVRYHLELGQSAADRFKDAGQIAPRLALWKYGWTMFKTHPLLGVGWGEFPSYQYELVKTLGGVEIANNSHDIFIDLLAKTGLIGVGDRAVRPGRVARARGARAAKRGARVRHRADRRADDARAGRISAAVHVLPAAGDVRVRPAGNAAAASRARRACRSARLRWWCSAGWPRCIRCIATMRAPRCCTTARGLPSNTRADPSFLFQAWGEYGLATLLPMNSMDLQHKLAMHKQAIALLPGETVLRRYAVLQALSGDTGGGARYRRTPEDFCGGTEGLAVATELPVPADATSRKRWPASRRNWSSATACRRPTSIRTTTATTIEAVAPLRPCAAQLRASEFASMFKLQRYGAGLSDSRRVQPVINPPPNPPTSRRASPAPSHR